ncbi:MAG: 2-oxo-4-hydroxy-4-carboxy-5-ureidoimidazoline decarboxylase [Ornithinibacter sp.]
MSTGASTPRDATSAPAAFNALPAAEAHSLLMACLGVSRWAEDVASGRPYATSDAVLAAASDAAAELSADELDAALAGHPRIGERASSPEHQSEMSEREQAGVDQTDAGVAADLAAGNAAYEERFDRVFLIRAAGRSAPEILAELHRRLKNDDASERTETTAQLREIAVLRLKEML